MTKPAPTTPPAAPAAPTPPAATPPAVQHDAVQQVRLLRDALQSDKVRVGCFLGAGCPSGVYDKDGKKTDPLIPDVARLTNHVRAEIERLDGPETAAAKLMPCWDSIAQACKDGGEDKPNVEHILTELRIRTALRGNTMIGGFPKSQLETLDEKVCDLIVEAVGKSLPPHWCSYDRLASWIGGVQRSSAVDIFTPSYDLLAEEAFERQRIPHFDGFVGSREPFFDVASIEQDAIPRRWTRLWKLHGSVNWEKTEELVRGEKTTRVIRVARRAGRGKAMIYPSHLKYDQSRRMPYLAMIDRLRAFFQSGGHAQGFGPPVLVVCGYSFSDDHLNEVLLDGLRGNPAAQCFALAYSGLDGSKMAVKFASEQPNLTVLAWDGAVVGNRRGLYSPPAAALRDQEPWIERETTPGIGGAAGTDVVRCRLGDFHFFGLFLERLYGGRSEADHAEPHA
jgi:hypothetical protein